MFHQVFHQVPATGTRRATLDGRRQIRETVSGLRNLVAPPSRGMKSSGTKDFRKMRLLALPIVLICTGSVCDAAAQSSPSGGPRTHAFIGPGPDYEALMDSGANEVQKTKCIIDTLVKSLRKNTTFRWNKLKAFALNSSVSSYEDSRQEIVDGTRPEESKDMIKWLKNNRSKVNDKVYDGLIDGMKHSFELFISDGKSDNDFVAQEMARVLNFEEESTIRILTTKIMTDEHLHKDEKHYHDMVVNEVMKLALIPDREELNTEYQVFMGRMIPEIEASYGRKRRRRLPACRLAEAERHVAE